METLCLMLEAKYQVFRASRSSPTLEPAEDNLLEPNLGRCVSRILKSRP